MGNELEVRFVQSRGRHREVASFRWALVLLALSIVIGTIVRSIRICILQFVRSGDVLYKQLAAVRSR